MGTKESIFGISMEHHFPILHQSCMHWYSIDVLFNLVFETDLSTGIIFSIVAPFVLVFVVITFSLFWLAFRYNIIYVSVSRDETDGLFYSTALNQLFTGIYTMALCIIGLFFLVREENEAYACIGQGTIMIFVTVFTAIFQILVNQKFGPLFHFCHFKREIFVIKQISKLRTTLGKCRTFSTSSFAKVCSIWRKNQRIRAIMWLFQVLMIMLSGLRIRSYASKIRLFEFHEMNMDSVMKRFHMFALNIHTFGSSMKILILMANTT